MTDAIRQRLHPEVAALADAGRLHPYDCEWISRLRKEAQVKAAEKCVRGDLFGWRPERRYRGRGTMLL